MNDARLEQVRDWAINCVALAPFADVGDFVALGHGALDVIDAYEALRTQLAEAQERETALKEALRIFGRCDRTCDSREDIANCDCGYYAALGIRHCAECRMLWPCPNADIHHAGNAAEHPYLRRRALSGEQANG